MARLVKPRHIPTLLCDPISLTPIEYVGHYFDHQEQENVYVYDQRYGTLRNRLLLTGYMIKNYRRYRLTPKTHLIRLAEQCGVDEVTPSINFDELQFCKRITEKMKCVYFHIKWDRINYEYDVFRGWGGQQSFTTARSLDKVVEIIKLELLK